MGETEETADGETKERGKEDAEEAEVAFVAKEGEEEEALRTKDGLASASSLPRAPLSAVPVPAMPSPTNVPWRRRQ